MSPRRAPGRLAAVLVLSLAGCGAGRAGGRGPELVLQPPGRLGGDFLLRQRLELRSPTGEIMRFEAALQHRGEVLTLLGLTPFGTRAFLVEQRGLEVSFTSFLPEGRGLPLPPALVLAEVHRVLAPWLGTGPLPDGVHQGVVGGERVVERWRDGRLLERRFRPAGRGRGAEVTVSFEGGMPAGGPPGRVRLDNRGLGYRLLLETLSFEALGAEDARTGSGGRAPSRPR